VHQSRSRAQALQFLLQSDEALILRESRHLCSQARRSSDNTDENETEKEFAEDDWFGDHRFLNNSRFSSAAAGCGFYYVARLGEFYCVGLEFRILA
jgi:hypothetical protein